VRTRWYDDAIARALATGLRQVVILAAGMDSRSYRLNWPDATRVFELDQPAVIEHKQATLAGAVPRCERIAIRCDLAQDWVAARAGWLSAPHPQPWLVEGLLQYLDASSVATIFSRIDALSPSGSAALYDVIGESMLRSPVMAPTLQMMRELGT
jgi:methyltransferase (TIGR00027 family)